MGRLSKKGPAKADPSPADKADAEALDQAVQTMIQGPLRDWDHTRPLGSLNKQDLRKLAMAAITGWILCNAANKRTSADQIFDAGFVE